MTVPKVNTIQRGGSRLYVHPENAAKAPGVTSVVGMLPKDFLKFWAAKVVAEIAVESLGEVVGIALRDPAAAVDFLKRAPQRSTGKSADMGTAVHELFESMAKGEKPGRLHPELMVYAAHFEEFLSEFSPKFIHLEQTVWSEKHGYAGSFDVIAEIDGEVLIGDWKTTKSGVHEEVALQLSAYRYADYLIAPDGTQTPLPEITGGFVLHARPEAWNLVPVRCDEQVFEHFLHLRQTYAWDKEIKSTVLGDAVNSKSTLRKRRPARAAAAATPAATTRKASA